MTREALEATLFPVRDPAVMRKFQVLNPNVGDVKAGSMFVLSDLNNASCTYQEPHLMQAAQHVEASLDPLTPDEADFLHRHGAEIAGFIGHTSTWLRGQTTLGDHPKLKTALGRSSRSLVHHWDKAGAPGQIPGYATHVDATSRAATYMKAGGYIGIGIGGVSSLLAIQQVCSDDSGAACEKIKFTEGGKFGLSTFGGVAGGWASGLASGPVCLAIGVATGGIGGVVCVAAIVGTGAWVGTTVGGMGGEYAGEKIYEATQP